MAHDGTQIAKDGRRHAIVERLIKKTQDGTLATETKEPMDGILEEDMGVSIGNERYETHNHYHAAPPPSEPPPPPQPPVNPQPQPTPQPPQQGGNLARNIAAAGLAALGIGAGITMPVAAYQLLKPDPEFVDTDTDTNTITGLRIRKEPIEE